MVVVSYLNRIFSAWDEIVEEMGIEKIKTIGDAYMVVSGIPDKRKDHVEVTIRFALRMLQALEEFNRINEAKKEPVFGLRVGLNCGTIVAGCIGTKKLFFDVWGAAANLASRMESTGKSGRIQVSDSVFEACKHVKDFR